VKDRFSVGRCCCGCEDCCNGNAPSEFDIDFGYTDNHCTTCDEQVGGVITAARVSEEICSWRFYRRIEDGWSTECRPDYSTYGDIFTLQDVRLSIRCSQTSEAYNVTLYSNLFANYDTGIEYDSNGVAWQTRNMRRSLQAYYGWPTGPIPPFEDFICDEVEDVELEFKYAIMSAQFEYYWPIVGQWRTRIERSTIISTAALPIVSRTYPGGPFFFAHPFTWTDYPLCEPPAAVYIPGVP